MERIDIIGLKVFTYSSDDCHEISLRSLEVQTSVDRDLTLMRQVDGEETGAVGDVHAIPTDAVVGSQSSAVARHHEILDEAVDPSVGVSRQEVLEDGSANRRQLEKHSRRYWMAIRRTSCWV